MSTGLTIRPRSATTKQQRRVIDVSALLVDHAGAMGAAITADRATSSAERKANAKRIGALFAGERPLFNLGSGIYALTSVYDPGKGKDSSSNAKIAKNELATVSLTLQSTRTATVIFDGTEWILNTCTSSGLCAALCVLSHGKGSLPAVIRARNWRTWCLVRYPELFAVLLAHELDTAVITHNNVLARLNVNSDLLWHKVPELFASPGLMAYDYTKHESALSTSAGWVLPNYRLIYSVNERSDDVLVAGFLDRGGSVAMVTNRRKGTPAHKRMTYAGKRYRVEDGDISDDRYATSKRTIVDLYAKGKARSRVTRFVRSVY